MEYRLFLSSGATVTREITHPGCHEAVQQVLQCCSASDPTIP